MANYNLPINLAKVVTVLSLSSLAITGALAITPASILSADIIHGTAATQEKTNCDYAQPKKADYTGRLVGIQRKSVVAPGEMFNVQVLVKNTGNVPWFSEDSGCAGSSYVSLGTAKSRDRISAFYTHLDNLDTRWLSGNRIKMDNKRVSPLDVAFFSFTAKAPDQPGIYREFFAPVAEGKSWIEGDALFSTDINVGNVDIDSEKREYLSYINKSANLSLISLSGEKNIDVDLSEQKMQMKIGDTVIRTFRMSSGKAKTPTPRGNFSIILKQGVRVAGKTPHYIMPQFMMFKAGGFGIHALPSLANDRGVFWREALNHIGSPRSHGCIRLLPADADFAFKFAELGTKVTVHS